MACQRAHQLLPELQAAGFVCKSADCLRYAHEVSLSAASLCESMSKAHATRSRSCSNTKQNGQQSNPAVPVSDHNSHVITGYLYSQLDGEINLQNCLLSSPHGVACACSITERRRYRCPRFQACTEGAEDAGAQEVDQRGAHPAGFP